MNYWFSWCKCRPNRVQIGEQGWTQEPNRNNSSKGKYLRRHWTNLLRFECSCWEIIFKNTPTHTHTPICHHEILSELYQAQYFWHPTFIVLIYWISTGRNRRNVALWMLSVENRYLTETTSERTNWYINISCFGFKTLQ